MSKYEAERAELWKAAQDGGGHCPLCTQRVQVYRRKLNAGMARALIALYKAGAYDYWVEAMPVMREAGIMSGDYAKLRFWDLLHRSIHDRSGAEWGLTQRGMEWLMGEIKVPAYALVFLDRCLSLEGPSITVSDALGEPFDFQELMDDSQGRLL